MQTLSQNHNICRVRRGKVMELKKVLSGLEKSWKTRKMQKVMENENGVSNNLMTIKIILVSTRAVTN